MIGIIILTTVAFILSIILVVVDNKFSSNEEIKDIINYLPGLNCGACGFGNCEELAKEILKDPLNYKKCKALRGDALKKLEDYLTK